MFWIYFLSLTQLHAATALPDVLKSLQTKYQKAKTIVADFEQENEIAALKTKNTSSGTLSVQLPNRVRWETQKPNASLLVSDGKTFWFYTPPFDSTESGQLIVRKSADVQSRLMTALLSASFGSVPGMKIERKSDENWTLTPAKGTAGTVAFAELKVNVREKRIEQVILQHEDGNRATLRLLKIEFGKKLDPKLFRFVKPPGTTVLDPK